MLLFGAAIMGFYATIGFDKPSQALTSIAVGLGLASILTLGIYQQHYLKGRVRQRQVGVTGAGAAFLDSLPEE